MGGPIGTKKNSGPKTTFGTHFRPRIQLLAICRPFLDRLGRQFFLGLKPLFGLVLGLENNFWPYFSHFWTNWAICRPFLDRLGRKFFLGLKPLFGLVLGLKPLFGLVL